MWFVKFAVPAAVVVALLGVACGGGGDGASGAVGDDGVREIKISMTDAIRFEPATIHVNAGEPVRLVVDNTEAASIHDFSIRAIPVEGVSHEGEAEGGHAGMESPAQDEYDLHLALESGHDGVLEFTPTEEGDYEFICTVTGHADAGMTGTLKVS